MARSRATPSDAARPEHAPLPLQWPLVGRRTEVEAFAATLADPRAHGFVLFGPAGVGKTRVADECLAVAHHRDRTVARATATAGAQSVPLGALAHLLPPGLADDRCDLVAVLDAVAPGLREQAENGPMVLFVDDAHRLDPTSATLVAQLVDADLVFLVATVRAGEPVPAALADLWPRARVQRVDIDALDETGIDTLLHLVLEGPVAPATIASVWSASHGNVMFVRELVLGALESGALTEQHGVWQMSAGRVATPRLVELVQARFAGLEPPTRATLDLVAAWEPTSLALLESAVDARELETLDALGLLAVRTDGRRNHVALAHPLYGEILRAEMPTLTRRRLVLEHAERIERFGARRREDPIRVAAGRVDAAAAAEPELLLRAARLARWGHDFPQVERLARAALLGRPTPEAGLLLGEALHELGAFTEAEAVFADAQRTVQVDDPLFALIAEMRALNLMWGLGRNADALAINRGAQTAAPHTAAADELRCWEATLLTYAGRPDEALRLLATLEVSSSPRVRALHAIAEVPSLISTGKVEVGLARARAAFAEHSELREQMAIADAGLHVINQIHALHECGRIEEAIALAGAAYDATVDRAPPAGTMWLSHLLGRGYLLAGRPATARRWLGEAVARCEQHDLLGPKRLALSLVATAHAWLGAADVSAAAVVELERSPEMGYTRAEQELGRAWALVAAGDPPGARRVLLAAADWAAAAEYRTTEAWLLHDIVRLGDASGVVARLEAVAADCEGPLPAAYAHHARAATGTRAEPFVEAADQFEAMGATLLAAEALMGAATVLQRKGDARASAALHARAEQLAEACEGARTPALATTAAVVPLSAREREIASFAARGETAKQIAERLFLSTRTVNNHLQNVYTKLGISGRAELAAALDDQ